MKYRYWIMTKYFKGCDGVLFMLERVFNKDNWYIFENSSWHVYYSHEHPVTIINKMIPGRNYTITELSDEEIREELFVELL